MIDPEKIWSSSQLPTLPMAAVRLLKLSKAPKVEIDDVVKAIKTDPALTARILKATNSSFFGLRAQVNSVDRAVPLLGTSMVTSLGLGFSLIDESMARGPLAEHFRLYWMQSIVQAATAELLSEWTGVGGKSECFQAGLLLDIGQLAMLTTVGTEYWPVLETAMDGQRGLVELETESLGINHAIIGLRLAQNWNLPTPLRTAIAHHHLPLSTLLQFEHAPEFELLAVAAVAASAGDYFCRANKGPALQRMHSVAGACFQFDGRKLEAFLEQAGAYIDDSASMFNVSTDQLPSPSNLMAQANAQLSDLVIMAQMESAAAVQRHQAIEQEKTELQSSIVRLQEKAFHDPLTGVYNRQYFNEAIHHEFALCCRLASPMAAIFVDIDHFKQFNDTYGHQLGDLVLRHVAGIMQSLLRECDTLARYGGEEFVVLVSEPSMPGLKVLTERIRAAVEQEKIRFEDQQVSVTVSLGAALAIPGRDEDDQFKTRLIAAADQAMYESKKAGRNRCCVRSTLPGVADVAQPTTGAVSSSIRSADSQPIVG